MKPLALALILALALPAAGRADPPPDDDDRVPPRQASEDAPAETTPSSATAGPTIPMP